MLIQLTFDGSKSGLWFLGQLSLSLHPFVLEHLQGCRNPSKSSLMQGQKDFLAFVRRVNPSKSSRSTHQGRNLDLPYSENALSAFGVRHRKPPWELRFFLP